MKKLTNERKGTLIVLTCHCVYDPDLDRIYAEHEEDRPVYQSDVNFAFNSLKWMAEEEPLLVISGGKTKIERDCSESRSYVQWAIKLGIEFPGDKIALEEYAMTSIENLLFSLYVYVDTKKVFPKYINIISWEFKRRRFERTLAAINKWRNLQDWSTKQFDFYSTWPPIRFIPVGDLWGIPKSFAQEEEDKEVELLEQGAEHGIEQYYQNEAVQAKIKERDKYITRSLAAKRYSNYPLPETLEKLKKA
jgi:hypothetical protein